MRSPIICLILLLLAQLAQAQSREIDPEQARIEHDGVISGWLDDDSPRDVFYVDGLRGEVIRFELTATEGELDPVLGIFDDSGGLALWQDDSKRRDRRLSRLDHAAQRALLRGRGQVRLWLWRDRRRL